MRAWRALAACTACMDVRFTFSSLPFSFYGCDEAGGEFRDTLCRRIGESPVLKWFEWMCKCSVGREAIGALIVDEVNVTGSPNAS